MSEPDLINSPPHYQHRSGVEVKFLTRHCSGNVANILRYLLRYQKKGSPENDLKKGRYYVMEVVKTLVEDRWEVADIPDNLLLQVLEHSTKLETDLLIFLGLIQQKDCGTDTHKRLFRTLAIRAGERLLSAIDDKLCNLENQ